MIMMHIIMIAYLIGAAIVGSAMATSPLIMKIGSSVAA